MQNNMSAKKLLNEILTGVRGSWEDPRHWQCLSPRTWAADFESIVAPYSPTCSHSETLKDMTVHQMVLLIRKFIIISIIYLLPFHLQSIQ